MVGAKHVFIVMGTIRFKNKDFFLRASDIRFFLAIAPREHISKKALDWSRSMHTQKMQALQTKTSGGYQPAMTEFWWHLKASLLADITQDLRWRACIPIHIFFASSRQPTPSQDLWCTSRILHCVQNSDLSSCYLTKYLTVSTAR